MTVADHEIGHHINYVQSVGSVKCYILDVHAKIYKEIHYLFIFLETCVFTNKYFRCIAIRFTTILKAKQKRGLTSLL